MAVVNDEKAFAKLTALVRRDLTKDIRYHSERVEGLYSNCSDSSAPMVFDRAPSVMSVILPLSL
jgi:hypothetical protein